MSTASPVQLTSALTWPSAVENGTIVEVNGGASRPLTVELVAVVRRAATIAEGPAVVDVDVDVAAVVVVPGTVVAGAGTVVVLDTWLAEVTVLAGVA